MAEFVQQSIEEMLPELEQMARVGLFTSKETRQILKKRKVFEYKLRRKTKHKEDFLQYIQYETNVLELVKKRRKKTGYTFKKAEIDWAISQRIHKLFKLATVRFQDDVKVWLSHIQYAKSNNEKKTVSKLFASLLQVHNKKPDLWLLAAKHEFEEAQNPSNARSLIQRGLRFNASSKKMWQEYFRMELLYVEKMLKRREILLQANIGETDETPDDVLEGKIPSIVYKQATEKFPDNVDLVVALLGISEKFDFAEKLQTQILKDLQTDYAAHPKTWDVLARRHLTTDREDRIDQFHAVFEEGVQTLGNEEIWKLYIRAFQEVTEEEEEDPDSKQEYTKKLLELYQRAEDAECVTPELYCHWVNHLVKNQKLMRAKNVMKAAVTKNPQCQILWKHRLQLMIESGSEETSILKTFRKSRKSVKDKESLPLWMMILDYCIACKSEQLKQLFEEGSLCCPDVSSYVKTIYLEWTFLNEGLTATRTLYTKLLRMKPLSLNFFMIYAKMESTLPQPNISRQRQVFEDAIMEYGETESDLWLDYISLEQKHPDGQPENIPQIYFRAKSTLVGQNNEDFITKYSLLQPEN